MCTSYSINEENSTLNPANLGGVLSKSLDYILEAAKTKEKEIPVPVIYAYCLQHA